MKHIWEQIENYLNKYVPTVVDTLNIAASEDQLNQLESEVGYQLPHDSRAYLKIHNGQDDPSRLETLCEEGTLLSVSAIIETYQILNQINESYEAGPVEWWNRHYLPITDCEGDHLAIDLQSSEIVMHVHDSGIERGIADSFR